MSKNTTRCSTKKTATKAARVKRLTPKPEVLRELFLLSGNNCAMPKCTRVIISNQGTVTGRVCHIEAAMPDGPRFNKDSTNEARRAGSNLILLCGDHHSLADDKKHESAWTVKRLQEMKKNHEAKFRGVDDTLARAFESEFSDATDLLAPTRPGSFDALNVTLPSAAIEGDYIDKARKQISRFVDKLSLAPEEERSFMLAIINRAIKLNNSSISVPVDDVRGALGIAQSRIKRLTEALERYGLGDISEVGFGERDIYCVCINDPSPYLRWIEIAEFCEAKSFELKSFVVDINFGQLD